MQYKNITLALVLLASSAIVTVSASAGESLETKLYDKVVNKKLTQEALAEFTELKPYQVNALLGVEFENAEAIKTAIETAVNTEELTLEQKILAKVVDKKLTQEALAEFTDLKPYQVKALLGAEFENAVAIRTAIYTAVNPEETLAQKILAKVVDKKLTQEALAEFTDLKPYQVKALLGAEFENAVAIKTAIETAVNTEELTLEQKILAKVVDKKVTSDTLAGLGLNDNQVSALVAAELTDLNSVKEALATVVVPVEPQSVPSSNEKPQATVENVKNCVGTTGKFNEEELKKINLTEDQITSLMAADFVINDDNIKKIIETTTKPAASAEPIAKPAESTNAAEDLKLKVDAILALVGEDGKMKEMTKEKIAELKLNQKQVDSLKAATNLSEANIKNILESNAEVDSSSVDSQASGKNEDKWYTSTWFMFFSGAVVLSALGGGAYMMTKKSDETDL